MLANQRAIANWSGDVAASITDLKLGRQALGDLALDGQLSPEQWQGQMNGILLDAPVDGQVTLLLAAQQPWSVEEVRGQVAWIGAQIGGLTVFGNPTRSLFNGAGWPISAVNSYGALTERTPEQPKSRYLSWPIKAVPLFASCEPS